MSLPSTIYRKILKSHTVAKDKAGNLLLFVDRHYIDETCFTCFDALAEKGRKVRRPDLTFAFADHTVPTAGGRAEVKDPEVALALDRLVDDCRRHDIRLFGFDSPYQGIMHVVAPEIGLTVPGAIVAGSDSHMTTHGGIGALGLGLGLSEQTHLLATQSTWHKPMRELRVTVDGRLGRHVSAKDLILQVIGCIGVGGAIGYVIEFAGSAIANLSVDARLTISNMAVEAGARAGIISPDDVTMDYLRARQRAPEAGQWKAYEKYLLTLATDSAATFDREVRLVAEEIAPMVTWGTTPEDVVPVDRAVPDPGQSPSAEERRRRGQALAYMGLSPGMPLLGLPIDRVFIGSCTNARLEDLREAASIVRGRQASIRAAVVPGSRSVQRAAEREGLADVFRAAGLQWRDPGCSSCVAMNGDVIGEGERCASTSNRNFVGRQGIGARTHLMSPAMAAAAAIAGRIADVREL